MPPSAPEPPSHALSVALVAAFATLAAGGARPGAAVQRQGPDRLEGPRPTLKDGPTTPIDPKDTWAVKDGVLRGTGRSPTATSPPRPSTATTSYR